VTGGATVVAELLELLGQHRVWDRFATEA